MRVTARTRHRWKRWYDVDRKAIPAELESVFATLRDWQGQAWQRARFLVSAFEENVWECRFAGLPSIRIDFHVKLRSSGLTDQSNSKLLATFKGWICAQDHPATNRSGNVAPAVMRRRVSMVLHLVDYLLLNAHQLRLEEHGLAALTRSDVHVLFHRLASVNDLSEAVYSWTEKVTVFLRASGSSLTEARFQAAVSQCPGLLNDLPDEDVRTLALNQDQLARARAYLMLNGLTDRRGSRGIALNSTRLSERFYGNTLSGIGTKPTLPELVFDADLLFYRELPSCPCRNFDRKRRSDKNLQLYNNVLGTLSLVPTSVMNADLTVIRPWDTRALQETFQTSRSGRTRTLPVPIVMSGLRSAIEFVIEFGRDTVDAFISLASAAREVNATCCAFAADTSIASHLSGRLRSINVDRWIIENWEKRESSKVHFARLRCAPTLHELLHVLVGSCVVIVGTLTARRQGELSDLRAGDALDAARRYLLFFNRKSGPIGLREREARPIPEIAVECIELLQLMQESLGELGLVGADAGLFQAPSDVGTISGVGGADAMYRSVDLFCDFFEIDTDKEGRRYYFRTHQLRRFFAMIFFWHAGYGQMDTIRWFLGHTDIEHLYRYVTESIPGQVLHDIKAEFALERMAAGDEEAQSLTDVVQRKFGASSVSLLDEGELSEYVTELLATGATQIEPVFFSDGAQRKFRIAIKVYAGG